MESGETRLIGVLEWSPGSSSSLLKLSQKKLAKHLAYKAYQRFKAGDPEARDYYTGRESRFLLKNGASHDPELGHMAGAPKFKTPQWIRTIK